MSCTTEEKFSYLLHFKKHKKSRAIHITSYEEFCLNLNETSFVPVFVIYLFQCIIALSWNSLAAYSNQELSVPQVSTLGRMKVGESV